MSTLNQVIKPLIGTDFNVSETLMLFNYQKVKVWSWGTRNFTNYNNMALAFKVSGNLFKGNVVVTLSGNDTYSVHLINNRNRLIESIHDVYFDELIDIIDEKVEKIPLYKF